MWSVVRYRRWDKIYLNSYGFGSLFKVCQRSLFSGCSGFHHQSTWPPRYSWYIDENLRQMSSVLHLHIFSIPKCIHKFVAKCPSQLLSPFSKQIWIWFWSGFGLRDLHSLLQLPAWRINYELCQYAIVLLLVIIPLITFKWIHICQCFRFSLSECKYCYNHS